MTISKFISIIAVSAGLLLVVCTLVSLLHSTSHWFIQIFNFPRLQAFSAMLVCLVIYIALQKRKSSKWAVALISLAIIVNAVYLYPYTPFATNSIHSAEEKEINSNNAFSIMLANVYMKNRQAEKLISIVRNAEPTLLLTMEVDNWWVDALQSLHSAYPHKILFPTANTYGMALYSKLPLTDIQTLIFNHDSVPSFLCTVTLPDNRKFRLLTVHPVAPKASEHPDNENNKEIGLLVAGKTIKQSSLPAIVAGDFNDVGWSPNVSSFTLLSGLKDVRYGRGIYNTFNAHNLFMRWPLDYVYASTQFKVVDIERLPKFGSDHFPLLTKMILAK